MPNQVDFRGEMPSVVSLRFPGHRILGRVLREVSRQDFDSGGPTTDIGAGDIGAQVRRQQSSSMYLQICGSSGTSKPRFGRGTGTGQQERSCSGSHLKTIFAIMPLSS